MKIKAGLALILLGWGTLFAQQKKKQQKLPNIIFFYADDLGYAETEPYGQRLIKTPHIQQLAREGLRFINHYTSTPVCAPARCMLLTGKHGGQSYIRGNYELGGFADSLEAGQMPLPEGTYTMAHLFKKAGYQTAAIGKWGLGMNNSTGSPNKQGFDYFFGYLDQKQAHNYYPTHLWENETKYPLQNKEKFVHTPLDSSKATAKDFKQFDGKEYAPELMTAKALAFIDKNRSKPFFLYLPYTLPHLSLQVPQEYVDKYKDLFQDKPYYGQDGYTATPYPRATYAGMITYLDDQVGTIMKHIKSLGIDDNTIILFSSDNGTGFNGGIDYRFFRSVDSLRGLKMDVFEGGIKVPLIVRWPNHIKANAETDLISAQYDLMATFAQLVQQSPGHSNGLSLLPTWLGQKNQQKHQYLYFEYPEKGGQLAIREGRWKAVKLDLKKNPKAKWQLYDLSSDPWEENDLAAQYPQMLRHFDEIVQHEHRPAHIQEWEIVANKMIKK
ncbi:arylsulfatase [Sphingobacterium multivorum]|jgi:arylsulfatase A-like enzyme|uniref:arylsulfatase n=1 Tax=Sphingobacterium multivorum TaxID=28454 RepID=UPI0028AE206B|nr:arylsulfatase [Sphingobacterium multivorum]MDF2851457.1 arylsulfatase [Sphingobacterium multivorum]